MVCNEVRIAYVSCSFGRNYGPECTVRALAGENSAFYSRDSSNTLGMMQIR